MEATPVVEEDTTVEVGTMGGKEAMVGLLLPESSCTAAD